MSRKSPRSRRKLPQSSKLPGKGRPRPTPGQRAKSAKTEGHAPKGARPRAAGASTKPSSAGTRAKQRATRAGRAPAKLASGPRAVRPAARKRTRFSPPDPARAAAIFRILDATYPDARCELDFQSPLQLLIATILSAQCTDKRVNLVTPSLFEAYPDAAALAAAPQEAIEALIRSTGFFRMKAKAIREASSDVASKHGGEVPRVMDELTSLRGVGRKTANVVLGNAYGIPGLVVDTHVARVSNRLALTNQQDPVKIETALMEVVPRERWTVFSHWLILHGRRVCIARKPKCTICPLAPHCPRVGVTSFQ